MRRVIIDGSTRHPVWYMRIMNAHRTLPMFDELMNELSHRRSEMLWRTALSFSVAVTIGLLVSTAFIWSRTEFMETTLVPKNPDSIPRSGIFFVDQIEWVEVPARPIRTMASAVFYPFFLCLLGALAIAASVLRSNTRARRAVALMAFLLLDHFIVLVFCVRLILSRWKT
jgi:hypothetical protein